MGPILAFISCLAKELHDSTLQMLAAASPYQKIPGGQQTEPIIVQVLGRGSIYVLMAFYGNRFRSYRVFLPQPAIIVVGVATGTVIVVSVIDVVSGCFKAG